MSGTIAHLELYDLERFQDNHAAGPQSQEITFWLHKTRPSSTRTNVRHFASTSAQQYLETIAAVEAGEVSMVYRTFLLRVQAHTIFFKQCSCGLPVVCSSQP